MTLRESYEDLAAIWRSAARAYAERAAKASSISKNADFDSPWSWDIAALRASRRATRYARLADAASAKADA